ncbi:MAG: hypothetical protein J7L90_01280 [Dehalococcoidia bacterium]|nr:hypothetical protein [Dehalococcoidia bacterium]
MSVTISIPSYESYFVPLDKFVQHRLSPPKHLVLNFLRNVEFIEYDNYKQTIHSKGRRKALEKVPTSREIKRATGWNFTQLIVEK